MKTYWHRHETPLSMECAIYTAENETEVAFLQNMGFQRILRQHIRLHKLHYKTDNYIGRAASLMEVATQYAA